TSGHRWSCLASIGARSARSSRSSEGGIMERADRHDYPSVEVQYTKDDYVAAYQLATSFTRRGWLFLILSILLICIAAFFFFRYDGAPLRLQLLVPVYIALGYALYGLAARGLAVPWLGRRAYARQPPALLPERVELRPEGLRFQAPRGESTVLWRDFTKRRARSQTTLLYKSPTPSEFLILPSRLAPPCIPLAELQDTPPRALATPLL